MHHFHFLAGGNTAQGFTSCFDSILPKEQQKRMYYIKGGPGVGKSTLMKRGESGGGKELRGGVLPLLL